MKNVVRAHHVFVTVAPDVAVMLTVMIDRDGRAQARLATEQNVLLAETDIIERAAPSE